MHNWTGLSLLRAALNKLTPETWERGGDFHGINEKTGLETHCIVGMCAVILDVTDAEAEEFLSNRGIPCTAIEKMNDNALSLAKFEIQLRKELGLAI